jgi:hypothetical protein
MRTFRSRYINDIHYDFTDKKQMRLCGSVACSSNENARDCFRSANENVLTIDVCQVMFAVEVQGPQVVQCPCRTLRFGVLLELDLQYTILPSHTRSILAEEKHLLCRLPFPASPSPNPCHFTPDAMHLHDTSCLSTGNQHTT